MAHLFRGNSALSEEPYSRVKNQRLAYQDYLKNILSNAQTPIQHESPDASGDSLVDFFIQKELAQVPRITSTKDKFLKDVLSCLESRKDLLQEEKGSSPGHQTSPKHFNTSGKLVQRFKPLERVLRSSQNARPVLNKKQLKRKVAQVPSQRSDRLMLENPTNTNSSSCSRKHSQASQGSKSKVERHISDLELEPAGFKQGRAEFRQPEKPSPILRKVRIEVAEDEEEGELKQKKKVSAIELWAGDRKRETVYNRKLPQKIKKKHTKKISTSQILGLSPKFGRLTTKIHFQETNDPTDPMYLLKSNYYRNNFIQEQHEVQWLKGNPGRVLLGDLIQEIPRTSFHKEPAQLGQIANVRDPTKFTYNMLHQTKNYYKFAGGRTPNAQDSLPTGYQSYCLTRPPSDAKFLEKLSSRQQQHQNFHHQMYFMTPKVSTSGIKWGQERAGKGQTLKTRNSQSVRMLPKRGQSKKSGGVPLVTTDTTQLESTTLLQKPGRADESVFQWNDASERRQMQSSQQPQRKGLGTIGTFFEQRSKCFTAFPGKRKEEEEDY